VGSRVRIAAAACLVASGLLAGGATATMAFADPALTSGDSGDKHTDGSPGGDHTGRQPSDPGVKRPKPSNGPHASGTGSERSGTVGRDTEGKKDAPGADSEDHHSGDQKNDGTKPDEHKPGEDRGDGQPGENQGGEGQGDGGQDGQGTTAPTTSAAPTTSPTEGPPPPDQGNCDDKKKDDHCSPGWPFPWPWPWEPGQPPGPGSDGSDGATAPHVPSGRPALPPRMQLAPGMMPPATEPVGPSAIDVVPGEDIAVAEAPIPPITLPVIVAPAIGLGAGGGSPGAPASPAVPAAPRNVTAAPPAGREPPPASAGSNVVVSPSSYRIGYPDYLRTAGMSQVAALAVPGVTGILVLTGAGGLIGYRQAKAGLATRTRGAARFVN
jgi:hypothetical protein